MREQPDQPTVTSPGDKISSTEVQVRWVWQEEEEEQDSYLTYAKETHPDVFFEGQPRTTTVTVTLDSRMSVEQFRDAIRVAFDTVTMEAQLLEVWSEDDESLLLSLADYRRWTSMKTSVIDGSLKALFAIMLCKRNLAEAVFEYHGPPLS
jgi:hypothetical protein